MKDEYSTTAKMRAAMSNRESASNGCLMRSTPLAVWASGLSPEELMKVTKSEVQMTHCNDTAYNTVYLYNFAIKFLLESKDDPEKAMKCMELCMAEAAKFQKVNLGGYEQDILSWLQLSQECFLEFKNTNVEPLVAKLPEATKA